MYEDYNFPLVLCIRIRNENMFVKPKPFLFFFSVTFKDDTPETNDLTSEVVCVSNYKKYVDYCSTGIMSSAVSRLTMVCPLFCVYKLPVK